MDASAPSWRATAIYTTCLFSVMVYDWLICLEREYVYIWKAKPTIVTALYFIIRYWEMLRTGFTVYLANGSLTYTRCIPYARLQVYGAIVTSVAVSTLLILRVSALWGNRKAILVGLILLLVVMAGINCHAGIHFGPPTLILCQTSAYGAGPCFATPLPGASNVVVVLWLLPFCFDVISTLLLILGIIYARRKGARAGSGILRLLIRDGAIYFIVISTANLINVGFYLGAPASFRAINSGMAYVVASIVASRLVLSLRQGANLLDGDSRTGNIDNTSRHPAAGADHVVTTINTVNSGGLHTASASTIALDSLDLKKSMGRTEDDSDISNTVHGIYIMKESRVAIDQEN